MDSRHAGRPSQVRPRPPSSGRPAPVKARAVAPSPTRLSRHRQIERRRDLPLVGKALLALAVIALGASILWIGSGGIGPAIATVANGFSGFLGKIGQAVASTSPSSVAAVTDVPTVVPPDDPYTSDELVDVTVNVPPAVVGLDGYTVRLWATTKDKARTVLAEVAVGPTAVLVIPGVTLSAGRNDLQASIVGPGGEGELSAVATWVLDTVPPKIKIIAPKDGASVNKTSVKIRGQTQANGTILARNDANNATASVVADKDGLFEVTLAVAAGPNAITITATDPAGNTSSKTVTVTKGSGKMQVSLTGTSYRFNAKKLPKSVTFTVAVMGPDGLPVKGATALFTVTIPGLEAIVSGELTTSADGTARFSTQIPSGAMPGAGLATVLVRTADFGSGTDRQVLTVQ